MPIYQPSDDSYLLSETLKDLLENLIKKNKSKASRISANQQSSSLKFHNITDIHNDINEIKNIKILDMGSGSGIQAETCRKLGFNNILTADIELESIKLLKQKGFESIKSNLFSNINKKNKFNLIIFNPPYLPEDKLESKDSRIATTGGKNGYELIIKFLEQAKSHLEKDGKILLLISSLSKPGIIEQQAKELGHDYRILNKKKLFFEEMLVYQLMLN